MGRMMKMEKISIQPTKKKMTMKRMLAAGVGELGLGAEDVDEGAPEAALFPAPVEEHEEEDGGVGGGEVDVGVGAAQEGLGDFEVAVGGGVAVADGADAGDEGEDVFDEDEDEEAAEEPEAALHGGAAGEVLDEVAEELDDPLNEILEAGGTS